jgi:hypothetical protein
MFESETSWLTLTNIILGAVTIICLAIVTRAVVQEVLQRVRKRSTVPVENPVGALQDDHSFVLGNLGITMADGGKKIDEKEFVAGKTEEDEPHIQRSEN